MDTIILHWISAEDISLGHTSESYQRRIIEYAKRNKLNIIQEYVAHNDQDSLAAIFDELINFLDNYPNQNIKLLAYKVPPWRVGKIEKCFTDRFSNNTLDPDYLYHECFEEPADHNARIWRYIDLPKLLDFLQTETLFFARADDLRRFDKYEGQYFTPYSKAINDAILHGKLNLPPIADGYTYQMMAEMDQQANKYNEDTQIKKNFINCWHMAEHENFAMWKIYADVFGVGIQSTYSRLCDAIIDEEWSYYGHKERVNIGKVRYIDRQRAIIPRDNMYWHYLHKSHGYAYEQELRCIVWANRDSGKISPHLRIKVDPNILIEAIYLNPYAPEWYRQNIEMLCTAHGIDKTKIHPSALT